MKRKGKTKLNKRKGERALSLGVCLGFGVCLGLAIAWGLLAFLGSPWIALFDLVCLALIYS